MKENSNLPNFEPASSNIIATVFLKSVAYLRCSNIVFSQPVFFMKYRLTFSFLIFALCWSCTNQSREQQHAPDDSAAMYDDEMHRDTLDVFSNERFQNVYVEKLGDSTFNISGKAQVFEATLNWVVEDGHNELKKGFATADHGAPAWGNFSFEVTVAKQDPNSVLHLILFESSAKDGSRQHELPVPLY